MAENILLFMHKTQHPHFTKKIHKTAIICRFVYFILMYASFYAYCLMNLAVPSRPSLL